MTFSLGNGAHIYKADFFQVPTDFWLNMYWLLLCATLIYLLGYGARALLVLRKDPRSRTVANIYLVSSAAGIAACVTRLATAFIPQLQAIDTLHGVGVGVRVHLRRGFRDHLGRILAQEDEVVLDGRPLSCSARPNPRRVA